MNVLEFDSEAVNTENLEISLTILIVVLKTEY
jgi:hypothetical protein